MTRILTSYLKGVVEEFKKISFPTVNLVSRETILVVCSIMIAVVLLAGIDFVFTQLLKLII